MNDNEKISKDKLGPEALDNILVDYIQNGGTFDMAVLESDLDALEKFMAIMSKLVIDKRFDIRNSEAQERWLDVFTQVGRKVAWLSEQQSQAVRRGR